MLFLFVSYEWVGDFSDRGVGLAILPPPLESIALTVSSQPEEALVNPLYGSQLVLKVPCWVTVQAVAVGVFDSTLNTHLRSNKDRGVARGGQGQVPLRGVERCLAGNPFSPT